MTKSRVFLYLCLSFIGGIAFASFFGFGNVFALGFLALGVGLGVVFWKRPNAAVLGFCTVVFALGVLRYEGARFGESLLRAAPLGVQTFEALVVEEPDVRDSHQNMVVEIKDISLRVLVRTQPWNEYRYGDILSLRGELKIPENLSDFDWQEYLARQEIYRVMDYPAIEVVAEEKGNIVTRILLGFKKRFRGIIDERISPPQSILLGAIILGDKQKLTSGLKEKLNRVGLRHVTAISGMHIAILTAMLMDVLIGIGLGRKYAFYASLVFIFLFILMIGAPPSAVRAGIMGGLFLLARHVGRLSSAMRAILFASVVMLVFNPTLLRFDIGFQLSFSAVMGIVLFSEYTRKKLAFVPNIPFVPLRRIVATTLSAQLTTAPVLIYHFGSVSIVAPLLNVLVLPIVPFIFGIGMPFGILGSFIPLAADFLSWPLWLLVTYMTILIDSFSALPFANFMVLDPYMRVFAITLALILIARFFFATRTHRPFHLIDDRTLSEI